MSEFIQSFVRVRPNNGGSGSGAVQPCLRIVSDTEVEVVCPPGIRPHRVDGVFRENADNRALWDAVGAPALACVLSGKFAVISVYGQVGSGKTHLLRGPSSGANIEHGFVGYAISSLAGNAEANLCVLHIHGDAIQDLVTGADNLKLKAEDGAGVVVQGASTVRIQTAEAGIAHVRQCIAKRDEVMAGTSRSKTASFIVYIFGVGAAQLMFVECCGSESYHAAPSLLSASEVKEITAKNKLLKQFSRVWVDSATIADPKALGFRDTRVTRFIQPGLAAAVEHNGFAAQITCVVNDVTCAWETTSSLDYAAACVKHESLKTVSEYKELLAHIEERMEVCAKEGRVLQEDAKVAEVEALRVKALCDEGMRRVAGETAELALQVAALVEKHEAEEAMWHAAYQQMKADLLRSNSEQVERLRNLAKNAPLQAASDVQKRLAEVGAEHQQRLAEKQRELQQGKVELAQLHSQLTECNVAQRRRSGSEVEAMKPVRELEKEVAKLRSALAASPTPSREDGLSDAAVSASLPLWERRDELDAVEVRIQVLVSELMGKEAAVTERVGKPESSSSDSSGSDDGSSSASESGSESTPRETAEERKERERRERQRRAEERQQAKHLAQEEADYQSEWSHYRETVYKDVLLTELLDKILRYLEYGTNCTMVTADGLKRKFVYIARGRKDIAVLADPVLDGQVPKKKEAEATFPISRIVGLHMGQHSPNYQLLLRKFGGRVDPARRDQPPAADELDVANMHRYYYRSLSFQFSKEQGFLDFICDLETDFEAWIVTLHRITGREAVWGKKLFVDLAPKVDFLSTVERDLCEINHLLPEEYLAAKRAVLVSNERVYATLHDLRLQCSLDLYHSQKLLESWMKPKWIVRRPLNYFAYVETLAAKQAQEKARLEAERAEREADEEEEDDDDDVGDGDSDGDDSSSGSESDD